MTKEEDFNYYKRKAQEVAKLRTEKQEAVADEAEAFLAHYVKASFAERNPCSIGDDYELRHRLHVAAKLERQLADMFDAYESHINQRFFGDWTETWDE